MRRKVLFLTAFLPHTGAAAEKNTMHMLEEFSQNFYVDLIYFKYSDEKEYTAPNEYVRIIRICRNSFVRKLMNIVCFPFVYPLFSVRFNWLILLYIQKLVKKERYDVIVCDHSQMFLYGKFIGTDIPKVMISHDVIAQRVGRTFNALIKRICIRSEQFAITVRNGHLFALCQKDCDLIFRLYGIPARRSLIYIDQKIVHAFPMEITNEYVFIGKWSRADNLDGVVWFFNEVVPEIDFPVTISIIGKGFPAEKIECRNENVTVKILGFVDNPYGLIANCSAVLSPLFTGAGIKVKVLEALGCGTPVLGSEVAFEGIDDQLFGNFMILCHTAEDYVRNMRDGNITLSERTEMKNRFISLYSSETVPSYCTGLF